MYFIVIRVTSNLIMQMASTSMKVTKRGVGKRGPTVASYLSKHDKKFTIEWSQGTAVGDNHSAFSSWLGRTVRDESLAPILDTKGWTHIDSNKKDKMHALFLDNFEWEGMDQDNHKKDILDNLHQRYIGYRGELHAKYGHLVGKSNEDVQAFTDAIPGGPPIHVLRFLLSFWSTEEFKKMSTQGKQNRAAAERTPAPRLGRTSMPQLAHQLKALEGIDQCRLGLYLESRKGSDGKWPDTRVDGQWDQMSRLIMDGSTNDEAMDAVLGPSSHGRVLCMGPGVIPSAYYGRGRARPSEKVSQLQQQLHLERQARESFERSMEQRFNEEREERERERKQEREERERERKELERDLAQMKEWMAQYGPPTGPT